MPSTSRNVEKSVCIAFARLTKVDEEKRLVYGRATQQVPDRMGEMLHYKKSKPYFEAWSKSQLEASMGKSAGNIRSMHGKNAAGIVIPDGMIFNDDEKAIDIVVKVVDDGDWKKVLAGVHTGFSIGGSYVEKSEPDKNGVVTYVGSISEISLVDRPALDTATFFDVMKADGKVEKREFAKPVMRALVRRDGKDLAIQIDDRDLPPPGEEFEAADKRFQLVKVENGKALVDEVYDIGGTPEELQLMVASAGERGMGAAQVAALIKQHVAVPPKAPTQDEIEAEARAVAKAAGDDPDKQVGLTRGGGKRLAWEGHIETAIGNLAKRGEAVAVDEVDVLAGALQLAHDERKLDKAAFEKLAKDEQAPFLDRARAALVAAAQLAKAAAFADEKGRKYPIQTEAQIKAAWTYINMPRNQKKYGADDLAVVKGRIKAAAKAKGVELNEKLDAGEHQAVVEKLAKALHRAAFEPTDAELVAACEVVEKREKVQIKKADGTADAAVLERVSKLAVEELFKALPADAWKVHEAAAEQRVMEKGLYSCGQLAMLIDSLCGLASSCEYEAAMEGDGSTVCDEIYGACAMLGATLGKMVAEEVAEATGAEKALFDGLLAKIEIVKATHTAVSVKRIQKMHDMAAGMGAKCAKADVAGTGGTTGSSKTHENLTAAGAAAAVAAAAETGDLAKSAEAIQKLVDAAVAKATEAANVRIKKLEDTPVTPRVFLRAVPVEKGGDGAVGNDPALEEAARLAASVTPVLKADGTVDEFATAVKMQLKKGGTEVNPRLLGNGTKS